MTIFLIELSIFFSNAALGTHPSFVHYPLWPLYLYTQLKNHTPLRVPASTGNDSVRDGGYSLLLWHNGVTITLQSLKLMMWSLVAVTGGYLLTPLLFSISFVVNSIIMSKLCQESALAIVLSGGWLLKEAGFLRLSPSLSSYCFFDAFM